MDRMAQRKMVPVVLVSTTYFGPIQWYQKLYRYDRVLIEQHESWQKQTYRNRCVIATTQGVQALTVPIEHSPSSIEHSAAHTEAVARSALPLGSSKNLQSSIFNLQSIRISDHGNWRHLHWQAIQSAYGESPFFEYYEDDLRPFFTEHNWELLIDFNDAICQKMCELLDIHPHIERTIDYLPSTLHDYREAIRPKNPLPDPDFTPRPYYQVYAQKHGFLPNLSILDLLLNMGPESIFFL